MQINNDRVRFVSGIIHGFVVLDGDLEIVFAGELLQQRVAAVHELLARSIPVHQEPGNAQVLGLLDLALEHDAILAGVAHVNVFLVAEPWLVNRQQFGTTLRRAELRLAQSLVKVGAVARR